MCEWMLLIYFTAMLSLVKGSWLLSFFYTHNQTRVALGKKNSIWGVMNYVKSNFLWEFFSIGDKEKTTPYGSYYAFPGVKTFKRGGNTSNVSKYSMIVSQPWVNNVMKKWTDGISLLPAN